MAKKIAAIVEARMTSKRLPGKHMLKAGNKPIIGHLISRLSLSKHINEIVVATTTNPEDDVLCNYVSQLDAVVFRGSESDVLGRVLQAAEFNDVDIICEVTGDCPLIDYKLVDQGIQTFLLNDIDYLNFGMIGGLPDGLGFQIFKTEALALSSISTNKEYDREHVTTYIKRNKGKFRNFYLSAHSDYYRPDLRLTLDENLDYMLVKKIFEEFTNKNYFTSMEIFKFLDSNPSLKALNKSLIQE